MKNSVRRTTIVSDGILVEFGTGECCYYPATFLLDHLLTAANHIFVNYDPGGEGKTGALAPSFSPADRRGTRLDATYDT